MCRRYGRAKHPSRHTFTHQQIPFMPHPYRVTIAGGCCRPYTPKPFASLLLCAPALRRAPFSASASCVPLTICVRLYERGEGVGEGAGVDGFGEIAVKAKMGGFRFNVEGMIGGNRHHGDVAQKQVGTNRA
jgi:hypothetical protein